MNTSVNEISDQQAFIRIDTLLTTEVDGELLAMNIEKGSCYGLNSVGTRVWALMAEPQTLETLCRQLLREFDVQPEVCRQDVSALLTQLLDEGLVSTTPV